MKLGIIIATYKRDDNRTPFYLERCLKSIKNQTYQDYLVILIGDKYEDNEEFENLSKIIDKDKIIIKNLERAVERERYYNDRTALWCYGGVNAMNNGITLGLENNIEYFCHLDHDDYWENEHLETISQCLLKTNSYMVYTSSNFLNGSILPPIRQINHYTPIKPSSGLLIHSSTCVNFKKIPLRYRNADDGNLHSADSDLWERIKTYLNEKNLESYFIEKITCNHIEEGYERYKK